MRSAGGRDPSAAGGNHIHPLQDCGTTTPVELYPTPTPAAIRECIAAARPFSPPNLRQHVAGLVRLAAGRCQSGSSNYVFYREAALLADISNGLDADDEASAGESDSDDSGGYRGWDTGWSTDDPGSATAEDGWNAPVRLDAAQAGDDDEGEVVGVVGQPRPCYIRKLSLA